MELFIMHSATSSLSGPDILLSTFIINTISVCSSFNITDQVS
jgi:hypothetical protein